MPKRKILFVGHATSIGGGERSMLELAAALERGRYEPAFVLPSPPGPLADALAARGEKIIFYDATPALLSFRRADVTPTKGRFWRLVPAAVAAARALRFIFKAEGADIIHTNTQKAHILATVAAWGLGVPVVWHMRDILKGPFARAALDALALVGATKVVAISRAVAAQFRLARRKVTVIYNAVAAPPGLTDARAPREALRAAWKIPAEAKVVGCVGQIAPWKGQDVFVDAAALLAPVFPDLHFVVVGGPLYGAREYFDYLKNEADRRGLATRFVFTGQVADGATTTSAFDALVHTPREDEPFGRVVVEAMARGVPVVAAARGGIPEVLAGGEGTLVAPPADARAVAAAVAGVLCRPVRAAAMAARGRATFEGRFRLERLAAEVATLYDAVTVRKGAWAYVGEICGYGFEGATALEGRTGAFE